MNMLPAPLRPAFFVSLCAAWLALSSASSVAAPDPSYEVNDLLLFFRNPTGTQGTDRVAVFSLGSTYDVFRRSATPGDPTYGTVISLGNISSILTTAYGNDWSALATSLYAGAAGNNGSTSALSSAVSNGDFARTLYVTKPVSVGSISVSPVQTGVASAIAGANSSAPNATNGAGVVGSNPGILADFDTSLDTQNPFGPTGKPDTAYTAINGGVMGNFSGATTTFGSLSNVALALDLFRVTPSTNNSAAWQNANNIPGVTAGQGYKLGTLTLQSNGDVKFVTVGAQTSDDYTVWAQGYPGAVLTDKQADYDNDGFRNVAEYAFGTDPTVGNRSLSSATAVSGNLTVGFVRRSTSTSGAPSYSVLSTTHVGSAFTNHAASISILTNSAPPGYQAASFTQPVSGSNFFYRIQAALP